MRQTVRTHSSKVLCPYVSALSLCFRCKVLCPYVSYVSAMFPVPMFPYVSVRAVCNAHPMPVSGWKPSPNFTPFRCTDNFFYRFIDCRNTEEYTHAL